MRAHGLIDSSLSREMLVHQEVGHTKWPFPSILATQGKVRFLSTRMEVSPGRAGRTPHFCVATQPVADMEEPRRPLTWCPPSDNLKTTDLPGTSLRGTGGYLRNGSPTGSEFLKSYSDKPQGMRSGEALQSPEIKRSPVAHPGQAPSLPAPGGADWPPSLPLEPSAAAGPVSQGPSWRGSQRWLPGLAWVSPCNNFPVGSRRRRGKWPRRPQGTL